MESNVFQHKVKKVIFFFNKNTHRERKSVFVGIRDVLRNASVLRWNIEDLPFDLIILSFSMRWIPASFTQVMYAHTSVGAEQRRWTYTNRKVGLWTHSVCSVSHAPTTMHARTCIILKN